jgi:glycopeptide antibiotics resistance protein
VLNTRLLIMSWLSIWAAFGIPWASLSAHPHWEHVRWVPIPRYYRSVVELLSYNRVDDLLNIGFYIPLGILCVVQGSRLTGAIGAGVVLSLITESSQLFSTHREASSIDLLTNVTGTIVGAIAGASVLRRLTNRSGRDAEMGESEPVRWPHRLS